MYLKCHYGLCFANFPPVNTCKFTQLTNAVIVIQSHVSNTTAIKTLYKMVFVVELIGSRYSEVFYVFFAMKITNGS